MTWSNEGHSQVIAGELLMTAEAHTTWTQDQRIAAFRLYCQLPFGRLHKGTLEIIKLAALMGKTPSSLAMKLCNFASLDPAIRESGRKGLKGASKGDREVWAAFHADWRGLAEASERILHELGWEEPPSEVDEPAQEDHSGATREVTTEARLRQAFFRRTVLANYQGRCCMTGLPAPSLLVASHIVPWAANVTQRLNPKNGLCLSALHDRAYDQGLLTVLPDLTVRVSSRLHTLANDPLGQDWLLALNGRRITPPERFAPDPSFLDFHCHQVFQP